MHPNYHTRFPVLDAIDLLHLTDGAIDAQSTAGCGYSQGRCVTLRKWLVSRGLAESGPGLPARLLVPVAEAVQALRVFGETLTRDGLLLYEQQHAPRYTLLHDPHGNFTAGDEFTEAVVQTYVEESDLRRNSYTEDDWQCVRGLVFESRDGERFRIYDGERQEVSA